MTRRLSCLAATLALLSCSDGRRYDQAIGVLIDVSGTYAEEKAATVNLIKRDILPNMIPGDTLLIVRIDSESYDKENLEALLTLDRRPSHANAQKLEMSRKLDAFAKKESRSSHTDIPGAIMLAAEYLNEIGAGSQVMLIFSDMQEDLPSGTRRELGASELQNTRVVAMNVKRLNRDNANPSVFRNRLAQWEERLLTAGAMDFRTLMDAGRLPAYLQEIR